MKKVLTRALMAVAVLAASFGAFAGVSSANELDYSTNPDAPTVVDQVPQGFVPLGDPSVVPNDDDCTVTTTQKFKLTQLEGYDPGQKRILSYGWEERTRTKQFTTEHEVDKFTRERTRTYTPEVKGQHYSLKGNSGIGKNDTPVFPAWYWQANTHHEPHQHAIYPVEGSTLHYTSTGNGKRDWFYFEAGTPASYGDWSEWSTPTRWVPTGSHLAWVDAVPAANWRPHGQQTSTYQRQWSVYPTGNTRQVVSGYTDWTEWGGGETGLDKEPTLPPNTDTHEYRLLEPKVEQEFKPEIPGTNVTYYVATVVTEDVDCKVAALTPTVNPSEDCDVQGTLTLAPVEGIQYLLDGEVVEGVLEGPLTGTLTAEALPGFVLTTPFEFPVNLSAALECVTPFTPEVVEAGECGVADTIAIPETEGVQYLLDGEVIEAGIIEGPLSGLITAEALEGFELDTALYVEFDLAGAVDCPEETTTTTVVETTTTEKPEVSSTSVVKPQAAAEELAFTGSSSIVGTLLGSALLLMGAAVLFFGRRKTTD